MKPNLLSVVFCLACTISVNGQVLSVIKDPDGYTNVHAASSTSAKIIARFYDGDVFVSDEDKNGWKKVSYWP